MCQINIFLSRMYHRSHLNSFLLTSLVSKDNVITSMATKRSHLLHLTRTGLYPLTTAQNQGAIISGFGGLGVACCLGFKPGRSGQDFSGWKKILSTPSFGREVKPWVPCRRFVACKRSLKWRGSRHFRQNYRLILVHIVPPFATRISCIVGDAEVPGGEWGNIQKRASAISHQAAVHPWYSPREEEEEGGGGGGSRRRRRWRQRRRRRRRKRRKSRVQIMDRRISRRVSCSGCSGGKRKASLHCKEWNRIQNWSSWILLGIGPQSHMQSQTNLLM